MAPQGHQEPLAALPQGEAESEHLAFIVWANLNGPAKAECHREGLDEPEGDTRGGTALAKI